MGAGVELREQLDTCYKKEDRYNVVIEYMKKAGILFRNASPDHINNCYRIMNNGSSIFVKSQSFKMNLCEEDKRKIEAIKGVIFSPNYKNKTTGDIDNVRPYSCTFSDPDLLKSIIERISGMQGVDINKALPPTAVIERNNRVVCCLCPNCSVEFIKAPRCPECGQLIQYNKEKWNKPKLDDLDAWERVSKLTGVRVKDVADFIHRIMAIDGFSYHVGAVDLSIDLTAMENDKYVQVVMMFGSGSCGAFQPKELIDYLSRHEMKEEIATWFMEAMRPYLTPKQKNVPYKRLNGYYYFDYNTMIQRQDEIINIFIELRDRINSKG